MWSSQRQPGTDRLLDEERTERRHGIQLSVISFSYKNSSRGYLSKQIAFAVFLSRIYCLLFFLQSIIILFR